MNTESYLIFVMACIALCIAPGPDMFYLLSRTIAQGRRAGIIAALGINAGAYVHLSASVLGISLIIATSPHLFNLIKWLGVIYLVYIGFSVLMNKSEYVATDTVSTGEPDSSIFWQGFLSDVLNPKVAIFYLAFLPQFIDLSNQNTTGQLLTLGVTLNMIGIFVNLVLVFLAAYVTGALRKNRYVAKMLTKLMGLVFIGLGIRLAREEI